MPSATEQCYKVPVPLDMATRVAHLSTWPNILLAPFCYEEKRTSFSSPRWLARDTF